MELSIFGKADSEMPLNMSKQSGAKPVDTSFEDIMMKSTYSSVALNSSSGTMDVASRPDPLAAKTEQTPHEITGAKKDGDLQGPVEEKTSFIGSDSGIHLSAPIQSAAQTADISFGNMMRPALPFIVNSTSEPVDVAVNPDQTSVPMTGQKTREMTTAQTDGVTQGPTEGKNSSAGNNVKESLPLPPGLLSQNASHQNLSNPDVRPAYSPVENAMDKRSKKETKSIASGSGTSSTKSDDRKTRVKAFEEAPADIVASSSVLSQNAFQSADTGKKSAERPDVKRLSDSTANAEVFKKPEPGIDSGAGLRNSDSTNQTTGKDTEDALRGQNADAIVKGDETMNSNKKVCLENLPPGKKGTEAPKAKSNTLNAKKSNTDELKQVTTEKTDSKAGFDGSTQSINVTAKNAKSFEHGNKAVSNDGTAKDEINTPVNDGDPAGRLNSAVLDSKKVNDQGALTPGWISLKNVNTANKKDSAEQPMNIAPGIGPAHGDKISTNQPAPEVRGADSVKEPQVFDTLADGLKMSLSQGGTEVRLSLHPEQLGKLNIKLVVEESAVKAKIQVDNAAVKGVLESDAGRLKDFFSRQGLVLEKYTVEISQHGNSMNGNGGFNGGGFPGKSSEGDGRPYAKPDLKNENTGPRTYAASDSNSGLSGIDVFI